MRQQLLHCLGGPSQQLLTVWQVGQISLQCRERAELSMMVECLNMWVQAILHTYVKAALAHDDHSGGILACSMTSPRRGQGGGTTGVDVH